MTTIYTFAQSAIEETQNAGRYGTADLYTSAVKSFRKFTGDVPLTFKELIPGLIREYEGSLLQKGRHHSTISTYMCTLRSIFNQVYVQGIPGATSADELFRSIFTGYEPITKRTISPAFMCCLSQLKLEQHPHLCFSHDLFLLSFYPRGIPFIDLVYLRKTDMRYNAIYHYRCKTRQQPSVYIEPYAVDILRRYANKHFQPPYLLPMLSSIGSEDYRQYKSVLHLYDQHLYQLFKMLHLGVPLTSYVARHSQVATAGGEGVAIAMISKGLGHSSEKVTNVYLASFNNSAMNKANRKAISRIYSKKKKKG